MRPGYDRVYSDTRRSLIPDLPVDEVASRGRREVQEHAGRAAFAIAAVFALMVLVAIGLGFYSSIPTRMSSVDSASGTAQH